MTFFNYVLLSCVLLLCLLSNTQAINRRFVVTSSSVCRRDIHCSATHFCVSLDSYSELYSPGRCVRRRRRGEKCDGSEPFECASGNFCSRAESKCLPRRSLNGDCQQDGDCVSPLACLWGRCNRKRTKKGDVCQYHSHCDRDLGLYCHSPRYTNGTCRQGVKYGQYCNLGFTSAPVNCIGICAAAEDDLPNACVPLQPIGGLCRIDEHCPRQTFADERDTIVCSKGMEGDYIDYGICARNSELIRVIGADCDPKQDLCDGVYGLKCVKAQSSGKYKCHHGHLARPPTDDVYLKVFCTPKSKYSKCLPDSQGYPTQCRRAFKNFGGNKVDRKSFYICRRKVERIPAGDICREKENWICQKGLTCQTVKGIRTGSNSELPASAKYCVKVVKAGEKCIDKFKTSCPKNYICSNGVCKRGTVTQITHSWIENSCSSTSPPCVPGAVCRENPYSKRKECLKQLITVRKGKPCFETAKFKRACPNGLICYPEPAKNGLRTCRERIPNGGFCNYDDEECASGLKCFRRYNVRAQCFNPSFRLKRGEPCDPKTGNNGGCFEKSSGHPMECRPKGTGYTCQGVAIVLRRCGINQNGSCLRQLKCGAYGACSERGPA